MSISAFAHLILDVKSIERSLRFYQDELGCELVNSQELDGHRIAYVSAQGLHLLFVEQPTEDQLSLTNRGDGIVLNFHMPNLASYAGTLKTKNIPVLRKLEEPAYGEKTLLILDPDGYTILLSEPVGTLH